MKDMMAEFMGNCEALTIGMMPSIYYYCTPSFFDEGHPRKLIIKVGRFYNTTKDRS